MATMFSSGPDTPFKDLAQAEVWSGRASSVACGRTAPRANTVCESRTSRGTAG